MRFPVLGASPPRIEARDGRLIPAFDAREMLRVLLEERYAAEPRAPARRVPFPYWRLPGFVRLWGARLAFLPRRWKRSRQDPPWPVAPAADLLRTLVGSRPPTPWGSGHWALCVTHDVDSVAGLRRCPDIAAVVERHGFRSCFYVVGEAARGAPAILSELRDRGHEIGSHDVRHDNRLCDLPDGAMEDRLRRARESVEPYGGIGFRSPSLLRSARLVAAVGRHFDYDSSVCDSDLEYLRGCTSVFPYLYRDCLELPVTLPMDSSLTYVGYRPDAMLRVWREKCEYIRALGGLAMMVTHAEPHLTGGPRLLGALDRFLAWIREREGCGVLLPSQVARDWPRGPSVPDETGA